MRVRLGPLALATLMAGCGGPPGPFPEASVVLVTIDTLRSDRLPVYGYAKGSTPNLDALAAEGIVFESAFSHVPLTLPSHSSLMTGLLPPRHGVRDNLGFRLGKEHPTLAEQLKAQGRRTAAAVSCYVLRSQNGLDRGFETYDDVIEIEGLGENLGEVQRDGAVAVETLASWVEGVGDAPFFAFLHLYEPHTPYAPPEGFRHFAEPYDGEIAYADTLLGRFVSRLRAAGRFENTIFVVTSDHGEGLGQHEESEHGIFVYRESLQVPLVLRLPDGVRGGTRVAGPIGLVDVAATILDLAGLETGGLDGRSLRASLAGELLEPRRVYAETQYTRHHFGWSDLYAAIEGSHHYVRAPRPELYDLESDPVELNNLVDQRGATASSLDAWIEAQTAGASDAGPEEADAETRAKLAALGYVGMTEAPDESGEALDPKDRIGAYEDLKKALKLRRAGKTEEAVVEFERVLADNPRMIDGWEVLAKTLIGLSRLDEAIEAASHVLRIDPGRTSTHMVLAHAHTRAGRRDLARAHAELAAASDPAQGYEALAQLMIDQQEPELAVEFARKCLSSDPERVRALFILGIVAQDAGRFEEALGYYHRAEQAKSRRPSAILKGLYARIGTSLGYLGQEAEAEQAFKREIEILPYSREARQGLATLYWSQQRDAEAREVLTGLLAAEPEPDAETYWAIVQTFGVLGDEPSLREWRARARRRYPNDARFGAS